MNRLLADLLAARVFLTMLRSNPARPIAQQRDSYHIYETGRARKTIFLLRGLMLSADHPARPGC